VTRLATQSSATTAAAHQDLKVIDTLDDMAGRNAHDPREVQARAFAAEFPAPKQGSSRGGTPMAPGLPTSRASAASRMPSGSGIAALYRLSTARIVDRQALLDRLKGEIDYELRVEIAERLKLDPF
jgi:hypothetical protein